MNYALALLLGFVLLGVMSHRLKHYTYIIMGALVVIFVYHAYHAG